MVTGGVFLVTGGVHLGIVAADTGFYAHFADRGLFAFVRDGWAEVFMVAPAFWGLCLMAGEILLGTFLLLGGAWARVGWVGVIAFHVLLMLFGFGVWAYSLPALAVLVSLAVADWRGLPSAAPSDSQVTQWLRTHGAGPKSRHRGSSLPRWRAPPRLP